MMDLRDRLHDRILGCLVTAGMGDAIGAPSEALSQNEILHEFNGRIETFLKPGDTIYAKGNILGEVTDDASQMYEMAKAVIKTKGILTVEAAADAIISWSRSYPKYYPRNSGPTTAHVINDLIAGKDPIEVGKMGGVYGRGTSDGAAMRVAAAGLCCPGDLEKAVHTAIIMSKPSHGNQHAYSGACAIACGISEAIKEESEIYSILKACYYGAVKGEQQGLQDARIAPGQSTIPNILKAIDCAISSENIWDAIKKLEYEVGNQGNIQIAVPVAIGIFASANGDPIQTIVGGANIGGDTDTIACIAGMLAGAYSGFSKIPSDWYETFKRANPKLDFEKVSSELTDIALLTLR